MYARAIYEASVRNFGCWETDQRQIAYRNQCVEPVKLAATKGAIAKEFVRNHNLQAISYAAFDIGYVRIGRSNKELL
jgi:hypothetical protein